MPENLFWLTVFFEESPPCWPSDTKTHRISITSSETIKHLCPSAEFRTSPIFPLSDKNFVPTDASYYVYLFCFDDAYKVLGRALNKGSEKLKQRIWYSVGLASVILITEDPKLDTDLLNIASCSPIDVEHWTIETSHIKEIKCNSFTTKKYYPAQLNFPNYELLPAIYRTIIDEFVASVCIIAPKLARHTPAEFDSIPRIVEEINKLIEELVYVHQLTGPIPPTLLEFTEDKIKSNPSIREEIIYQDIDRIIQVNAALSYVSTQGLSGAIPILERRSIIRRHSLLGIGTAILALNRISRSIEKAFSMFPVENVIEEIMTIAPPLNGINELPAYNPIDWEAEGSVDHYFNTHKIKTRDINPKLPYYSGRLGFRETEYTISAAQQSVTAGASLDWSLLTITHELVHGHVRNIINAIFYGDANDLPENKQKLFYDRFISILKTGKVQNNSELDSIRTLIFTYCCQTPYTGSLTHKPKQNQDGYFSFDIRVINQERLWRLLRRENRNIHEIFSHILDFHYFYGSCLQAYVPLIWRSWSAVPHVRADMRQYILRSLLAISATVPPTTKKHKRFTYCVQELHELLKKQEKLGVEVIQEVNQYLEDAQNVHDLFPPFQTSLILVDLVNEIFVSDKLRSELIADPNTDWDDIETEFEYGLRYSIPDNFSEDKVIKPTPYLISRVIGLLDTPGAPNDLESRTAKMLLACCSK